MEIDVTKFVKENAENMMDFSASIAEIGTFAAKDTWQASLEAAEENNFLDTEEKRTEARDYFLSFGAWDETEVNRWTDNELNALTIQEISSAYREFEHFDSVKEALESDQVRGNLYPSDDDQKEWFLYMGM